jgi:trehalose synthase
VSRLAEYAAIAGPDVVQQLELLSASLRGLRVVHVNSTRTGGGVAEILQTMVPLMRELGLDASWEVIEGSPAFFEVTKQFHNGLQGQTVAIPEAQFSEYQRVNEANAERLAPLLRAADIVFIHDPQPAALARAVGQRQGRWVWRCHIDVSRPSRQVWRFLRPYVAAYDAAVFSMADFVHELPCPTYLIPPSIDPLAPKNVPLPDAEVVETCTRLGIDPARPLIVQVSRFDRFKDPVGVIEAFRLARPFIPGLQLVLAGGSATDDPEGATVEAEVRAAAGRDADIIVLQLPNDAHRTINALQRAADVVLQKSTREGFGLTVAEALWKGRPVVGGDTGGIRLQVVNHQTGFLVRTPEGAAIRIRYLMRHADQREAMGQRGREHVRQNFLVTRQLREYLTIVHGLVRGSGDRIEVE